MDALILSCSTGGGHNAAAKAVYEELIRKGHNADFLDPYTLSGNHMDARVADCYIKCVQKAPRVFGGVYRLGNLYRRLPGKSPVYAANAKAADRMDAYLKEHSYDVILITHLFAAEILTHLRKRGVPLPAVFFIATDYTCIPFTEETACDYYIIPSPLLRGEFVSRGIASERIVPFGIPVRQGFRRKRDREKTLLRLGLRPEKRYIMIAGGSMGAGEILKAADILRDYLREHEDTVLLVTCGSNRKLYDKAAKRYRNDAQILPLHKTEYMAEYLKVCDLYLSKPGGLSSTEAAVAGIPLIHISPIPGCETRNERFFAGQGMSIGVRHMKKELLPAVRRLADREEAERMLRAQRETIDPEAAEKIVAFAEEKAASGASDEMAQENR